VYPVSALDTELITASARKTGRVLVVDEDYNGFGLSGEIAAVISDAGIKVDFARVCTEGVVPFDRAREDEVLPNVAGITEAAQRLCEDRI
jgi:pyruvate dehydrogenase E1 component beta subunit